MELNIKLLFFIFLTFLFYSCNSDVSITHVEVSPSWRGTPGKLVVKKGMLVDTIYDCQFGNTPEYKLLKNLGKAYLYTSCQMNNGGDNYQTFAMWSLEDATFLDTLFYKNLNISKEIRMNDRTFNWIRRKGNLKLDKNTIIFEIDSIVTLVENDVTVDTISIGKSNNRISLIEGYK